MCLDAKVEKMIHQRVCGEAVEEMEAEIKKYQSENRDKIAINQSRRADEEKRLVGRSEDGIFLGFRWRY
jgi:hypothetical protein